MVGRVRGTKGLEIQGKKGQETSKKDKKCEGERVQKRRGKKV